MRSCTRVCTSVGGDDPLRSTLKNRRAPTRQCRDARVYGHPTTAMFYYMGTPLPPPPPPPPPPVAHPWIRVHTIKQSRAWYTIVTTGSSRNEPEEARGTHARAMYEESPSPPEPFWPKWCLISTILAKGCFFFTVTAEMCMCF